MRRLLVTLVLLCVTAVPAFAQEDIVIEALPFTCDKPGTYVLNEDIQATDSGIHIKSNDVVIDLKGHTLTYGAGVKKNEKAKTYNSLQSGNVGHHAIYVTRDPRASKDAPTKAGWNYRFTGVVIRNGRIRHGSGKGLAYSDAIDVTGTVGCEIKELTLEISAPDCSAILGGRQSKIHHCTIRHTGTHVTNRHAQLAVIVSGPDAEVSDCRLLGGPQVGVKAMSGAEIHHNEIRINVVVTNGYGIQGYGQKNVHAHHNLIIAANGRGLHVSEKSTGWNVHHNYIEARERANREYPKGLDTHGIKLETCSNAKIYENVVVCESTRRGNPTPLNFGIRAGSRNEVYGNVFVAKKLTPKERATAIYLVGGDGTGTRIYDNVFFSNDRILEVYWHPGNNFTFSRCRFYKLNDTDKITTLYFWNTKPASNIRFADCVFGDGIDPQAVHFPKTNEKWPADANYTVSWTLSFNVKAADQPVQNAKITVTDKTGNTVTLTTDKNGNTRAALDEFTTRFDAAARKAHTKTLSPYVVRIDAPGKPSRTVTLPLTTTTSFTIDLVTGVHQTGAFKDQRPSLEQLIAKMKKQAGPRQ